MGLVKQGLLLHSLVKADILYLVNVLGTHSNTKQGKLWLVIVSVTGLT